MISIIICHRSPKLLEQFKENVASITGTKFEFVIIDNSKNQYNIFQAYNLGVKQSKGDILCFAHEDILFHTQNWGEIVKKHFAFEDIGIIGTAGGNAFPNCPAPWWNNKLLNDHLVNNLKTWNNKPTFKDFKQPQKSNKIEAVAVDGYWMCIKRELFENGEISFDEDTFDNFHCYDTDICFQVLAKKKRVFVVYDILIEHLSKGNINYQWIRSTEKLADKWAKSLPVFAKKIDKKLIPLYHYKNLLTYCYWMQGNISSDIFIRKSISKYLKRTKLTPKYKEFLLLFLWKKLGYNLARFPFKIFSPFFK